MATNYVHEYAGTVSSRHARKVSKIAVKAITGDRLEELLGKSTKAVDPGPSVFRKSAGKK